MADRDLRRRSRVGIALALATWVTASWCPQARGGTLFSERVDYPTPGYTGGVTIADVNNDGARDLLVVSYSDTESLTVYFGNGDGTFGATVASRLPWFSNQFFATHLDGDAWIDVAMAAPWVTPVALGNGSGAFSGFTSYDTAPGGDYGGSAIGLLNADSDLDLVVLGSDDPGYASVLLGNGDGTFQPHVDYETRRAPYDVDLGDFNEDGALDMVVAASACCPEEENISVLLGNGDGSFEPKVDLPVGCPPGEVSAVHLNSDGHVDLVIGCLNGTFRAFLGGGNGAFSLSQAIAGRFVLTSMITSDFDQNGAEDIVAAFANVGTQNDSIYIYRGVGDGTFQPPESYGVVLHPTGMAAGEVNDDSRADLVVASVGESVLSPGTVSVFLNCNPCGTTAISVALEEARTEVGLVRLYWIVPDASSSICTVQRRTAASDWVELGLAASAGLSRMGFEDRTVLAGERYAYRLFVQTTSDQGFSSEVWVTVPTEAEGPLALRLDPVYPNPIQSEARFNFSMPRPGRAKLGIYSVTGRLVAHVLDQDLPGGWRSVSWGGRGNSGELLASGTYFAKLESAGQVQIRKVVLAR